MKKEIYILSLGAGVQSSTLALLAAKGAIQPPVAAIFADVQAEPRYVYDWIEKLKPLLPFPVFTVTAGNLETDFLAALSGERKRCAQPPFFVRNDVNDGTSAADGGGTLWRKCTKEYKLGPIRRKVAELKKEHGTARVVQQIGISVDEAQRMKDSGVQYIRNDYPLVDARMSRRDCLKWLASNGYPPPPKSACYFCPFKSNAAWRDLRDNHSVEFSRAVNFDNRIRELQAANPKGCGITGKCFLHRSFKPLQEAFLGDDPNQGELFGNECEGLCGV